METLNFNIRELVRRNALKAFLITFAASIAIVLYIAAAFRFDGQKVHRHQWVSTFAIHKREMLEQIYPDSPVLLMSGDSTALFGIDAEALSTLLQRPVFNYGLGAASGLQFILDEVGKTARPGDTVVLMLSDVLLAGTGEIYLNDALVNILDANQFKLASISKQIAILLALPWKVILFGFDKSDVQNHFNKVYSVDGFNDHGDMNSNHLSANVPPELTQKVLPAYSYTDYSIAELVTFKRELADRQINLAILPSPRIDGYLHRPDYQSVFESNQVRLKSVGLNVVEFQDGLNNLGFGPEHLYDFDTHLNSIGRERFTKYLANSLNSPKSNINQSCFRNSDVFRL